MKTLKILSIVGARPQFIKVEPIIREVDRYNSRKGRVVIKHILIHSGQHYDYEMSRIFFKELNLKKPNYYLNVGSGSHSYQTAEIMKRVEKVVSDIKPEWVFVYGDTNTTLGGALASAKLHIPIAHIEAGLRSYRKEMPEELNRVLTDNISNMLFCPTKVAVENLKKEGFRNVVKNGEFIKNINDIPVFSIDNPLIINVGDIMIDVLIRYKKIAEGKKHILKKYSIEQDAFYILTIHRAENTNSSGVLRNVFTALGGLKEIVLFPAHPRTSAIMKKELIPIPANIRVIKPVGYLEMLLFIMYSKGVLTDSGGVQKEAYMLKKRCITLRNESEWQETLNGNFNVIGGISVESIRKAMGKKLHTDRWNPLVFGDGKTGERILNLIKGGVE